MAKRMKEKTAKRLEHKDTRPTATARYVRMGAPKAKRVLDIIKGKKYNEACGILDNTTSTASLVIKKVLNSAGANAENNMGLNRADLRIAEITIDQGPTLKRAYAAGKGSSMSILKRTSHINVVLDSAK